MPKLLTVAPHLTESELEERALGTTDADERLRWIAILKKKQGRSSADIADICLRNPDWVRRTVRAYNERGPDAVRDGRQENGKAPILDADGLAELKHAVEHEVPPGGGLWNGPKVARWMSERLGRPVHPRTGWAYLRFRLGRRLRVPLPSHPQKDEEAFEAFKKGGSIKPSRGSHRAILEPL